MSKTEQNLWTAFAGESQANQKYLAFAQQAEKDGFPLAAKLFRAAAAAETVHAHSHLRLLGGVKTTEENLKEAVSGETHEFKTLYPRMMEEAKEEGRKGAALTMGYAAQVEGIHAGLFQKVLDSLKHPADTSFYLCNVCGYIAEDHIPDFCPVCGSSAKVFSGVD